MTAQQTERKFQLPTDKALQQAFKLSLKTGKELDSYFYEESCGGGVSIVTYQGDKILFKNNEEHTSPIKNTYQVDTSYLVVTENTIYILSKNTPIVNS
jgi:hypothetical protein